MDQNRTLVVMIAIGFLLLGAQVTLFHYRGNFRNPAMWTPVIGAPLTGLVLLAAPTWLLVRPLLWLELVSGLIGFGYHARGVSHRLGGFKLQNILTGPPIFLPLMLSFLAILGLMFIGGAR